jgi:hypothetical protein
LGVFYFEASRGERAQVLRACRVAVVFLLSNILPLAE